MMRGFYRLHWMAPKELLMLKPSCAKRWRFRAAQAECSSSSALPARRPLPTHSRREHSEDLWISLWTSTTQERSATCSSTARMAAKPSTITFRSPGLPAPWTKGHWDPGAFGLFPYFKNKILTQCKTRGVLEQNSVNHVRMLG